MCECADFEGRLSDVEKDVAMLEKSVSIFEFEHPDRIRLQRLERTVEALIENATQPLYAAEVARTILKGA